MLTKTKIALAAAVILGAAGVAQASTGTSGFTGSSMSSAAWASAGVAPGVNPSNPQDLTNLSNPQDLTLPGASNPQNLVR
jgi:anthranilate phosphoribosyltransferase